MKIPINVLLYLADNGKGNVMHESNNSIMQVVDFNSVIYVSIAIRLLMDPLPETAFTQSNLKENNLLFSLSFSRQ